MNVPDSHIRWRVAAYIALWSVVSSAFACVMMPLTQQPIPTVWLDGAIFGGWYALLVPFLWNAIKYGNLLSLQSALKTIVFVALGLLTVVVWLGLSLFSLY